MKDQAETNQEHMMHTVYSVVVGDNDQARLEAYLYDHTTVSVAVTVGRFTAYVLRTRALSGQERALYLSNYQTQRLTSGGLGVRLWGVTQTAALNNIKQFVGDELDSNELSQDRTRGETVAVNDQ